MFVVCVVMWAHMQAHGFVHMGMYGGQSGTFGVLRHHFHFILLFLETGSLTKLEREVGSQQAPASVLSLSLITTFRKVRDMNSDHYSCTVNSFCVLIYLHSLQAFFFFPLSPTYQNQVAIKEHVIHSLQGVGQLRFQKACKLVCLLPCVFNYGTELLFGKYFSAQEKVLLIFIF